MAKAANRRGNHEGSIYFDRSAKLWVSAITMAGSSRGRQTKRKMYSSTREQAAEKLIGLQAQAALGTLPSDTKLTVQQFAYHSFLPEKRTTLRRSTYVHYVMVFDKHIGPTMGHIKLAKLRPSDIQDFYGRLQAQGLSTATVHNYNRRLNAMLNRAVELDLLVRNPAKRARLPRLVKREVTVLSAHEMKTLIKASDGDPYQQLLVLSLSMGLRQSEALGLTWGDVSFDRAEILISRALHSKEGGGHELTELKTASSTRRLVLPQPALKALKHQRIAQIEHALALGPKWNNLLDLVFTNDVGGPVEKSNLRSRHLKEWLKTAGLPSTFRWHDLRHACASSLFGQGVPGPVVQQLLGHSSLNTTMGVYGHLIPSQQSLAAEAMDQLLA